MNHYSKIEFRVDFNIPISQLCCSNLAAFMKHQQIPYHPQYLLVFSWFRINVPTTKLHNEKVYLLIAQREEEI